MLTSEQIRAARAMLRWEQTQVAERAKVSVETIRRLEKMDGVLNAQTVTIHTIQEAFESAGLEFIFEDDSLGRGYGKGIGVTFAKDHYAKTRARIISSAAEAVDVALKMIEKDYDLFSGEPEAVADNIHKKSRFLFVRLTKDILQKAS